MSGNTDELPERTGQRDTTTRSDQLNRRQQLADELGVDPSEVTTTDTIDDGVQTRLTDTGRQQAEQSLRERFADERPNVTPADVTASVDPEAMTGRAQLAEDRRGEVRSRVQQALADENDAVDPADIGVSLGPGGVEDVNVDAREVAIEQAASQSDRFDADDFTTEPTEDGFETRLTESARERATEAQADALRQEAAEQLEGFGAGDIVVEETDSGLEADVRDSALREQVIEQAQSSFEFAEPSREDISVEITDDGASATIAADVRRQEALQQAAAQLEAFGTEDITLSQTEDGGFEASVPDDIQREAVREQAASQLDDFGPSDIAVTETDDGFAASVRDSAQREAVRDQAASELDGFSESDITVSETDDGFSAEVTEDARRREVREDLFGGLPDDLSPTQQFANPATGEVTRVGVERAEDAFESGDLSPFALQDVFDAFESDETVISEENQIDVPTRDPDDVRVSFEPAFETRTVTEGGEQRQVRERVGEQAQVELTDAAQSEREQLLRENLRDSAAEELDQFEADDIRVTETDDGLQAEVRPSSERTFLLNETSDTLFVTAAGGDTLQAAIDLRPDLQSIPGRDSINSALEDSGSDLRSTAPVGEILQELDPEEVAERQDDLGITAEQVRTAQQGIEQERQEALFNPDEFVSGVDDLDITDALQFDQATEQGRERRSELRQRADEIEQEAAADAGVDASEVEFRATVDGLEATEATERTLARGRAAQQFGVDASNVVVEETGDGFEASLETDFAEAQALQQAASQTGIDPALLDAEADGGAVDVGIDRDALRQSVADEQGVSVDNVELRETEAGIEDGINEEVQEARIERQIAGEREGVSVGDVDADVESAFSDNAEATIEQATEAASNVTSPEFSRIGTADDVQLTREQQVADTLTGGRVDPVVDTVEGGRQAIAEGITTGTRDTFGIEDAPDPDADLTGEQAFLNDVTGGVFGDIAAGAEDIRADAAAVADDVADPLVRGATAPARITAGLGRAGADALDDVTADVNTESNTGAQAALSIGAAGVVTPEPTTSVGGGVLAAGALGVLAADAVRRGEIDVPDTDDLLGGGGAAEIETPQRREPLSEIEAPSGTTQNSELDVGGETVTSEIDVPDDATPGVTEVGVPAADASAIIDETPVDTPGINQPDIDQPTIDEPASDVVDEQGDEIVDREPFVFPGNGGTTETDAPSVESPTVDAPASSFETDIGVQSGRRVDAGVTSVGEAQPDVTADAPVTTGFQSTATPISGLTGTTIGTPTTGLTVDGTLTSTVNQSGLTGTGGPGTQQGRGRTRGELSGADGDDAEGQPLAFERDEDVLDSGIATAADILDDR